MASQQYEENDGRQNDELDIDNLLIMVSQEYEAKERRQNDRKREERRTRQRCRNV